MKSKKLGIKAVILMLGIIPLTLGVVILALVSINNMTTQLENGVYEKLQIAAKSVAEWYAYDIEAGTLSVDPFSEEDTEFIDSMKDENVELTLFQSSTRMMTSIAKDDDKEHNYRNISTTCDANIWSQCSSGSDYHGDNVQIAGEPYYVYYTPIEITNPQSGIKSVYGMGFAGTPESFVKASISSTTRTIVIIAVIIEIFCIAIIYFISNKIQKPIVQVAENMNDLADGNLGTEVEAVGDIEEIHGLIESAKTLKNNLQNTVGGVKRSADSLSDSVSEVNNLSQTSSDASGQISNAISDLAQGATSMAQNVETIATEISEMGLGIDAISENAESLVNLSNEIKDANNVATTYISRVSESSEESVRAINDISSQIDGTNKAIDKVKSAVEMISSIASQTNLLALNASIEAARAGEAGRGFAVVATEIGNLSDQSNNAANEIKQIVDSIVTESEKSVEISEKVSEIITKEQEYIKETQEKFEVLNNKIGKSLEEINSISDKVVTINNSKNNVMGSVQDLSAISEENAASTEEVSASIENIAASSQNIADKSTSMNELSNELKGLVAVFKD